MKNYQNPFGMNPNMYGEQQGLVHPPQQGLVYGPGPGAGYGPEEMNIPQMGYPGGAFPQNVAGGHPYPIQQHLMNDDCGCGADHNHDEAVMPATFNPYGPEMAPNMMAPHGPHGPGCTCGHHHGPMGGPGMMGGFGPGGPGVGPMMGGFGPQGPASGFGPGGPNVGPMSGFGPGGPGNPGMMAPQGPGMAPNVMGPHGPGCTCGHHHGPMGGFGR